MKKLLSLFVVLLFLMGGLAWGGAEKEKAQTKVKFTFWMFGSEDLKFADGTKMGDWYRANFIKPFMDANPNVEIDYAIKGYEAGGTTLFIDTALAAGQAPDVYRDAVFRISKYANKDLLLPLDPILTSAKKATFDPSWVPMCTRNGKLWGILTVNTLPDALIVNRAIFKAAGAEDLLPKEPNRDWTTDQFEKALAAVTKAPDRYGTIFFAKTPSYDHAMYAYLTPFGVLRFKPGDYSKVVENTPDGVAAHKWIKSILDKGLAVPGPAGLVDDDADAYLLSGRTAISAGGWYELGLVAAGKKDGSLKIDFDPYMVNYPYPAGKKPGPLCNLGGEGFAIFKSGAKDREAAALKFVDFVTTPENTTKYIVASSGGAGAAGGGQGGLPLIKGVDIKAIYGDDKDAAWIMRIMQERGVVDLGYAANNFNELRAEWAKLRQAVWSGDVTAEQGLADFEKKAADILAAAP